MYCVIVISALQKSIRRGLVRQSLFWAGQLIRGGFGHYMLNRLLPTIACEDIGFGWIGAAQSLHHSHIAWNQAIKRSNSSHPQSDDVTSTTNSNSKESESESDGTNQSATASDKTRDKTSNKTSDKPSDKTSDKPKSKSKSKPLALSDAWKCAEANAIALNAVLNCCRAYKSRLIATGSGWSHSLQVRPSTHATLHSHVWCTSHLLVRSALCALSAG